MRGAVRWVFALLLVATFVASRAAAAEDLLVYAAASLTDALKEIGADFEKAHPVHVAFNFGASSTLARQIQEGAPADVFFSADEAKMDALAEKRLIVRATRRSILSNTLVVVVPSDRAVRLLRIADLASTRITAIAVAEPTTVPAGIYAKEYLLKMHLWEKVTDRLIPTDNVRATLDAVESGNADAGIVYKTDALISKKVRVAYEVPLREGPRISYPAAVVAGAEHEAAARAFVRYLTSNAAQKVFVRFGFLLIKRR
jgi:molybdate transport system substrate-binding protein